MRSRHERLHHDVPLDGEHTVELARVAGASVEHILTGTIDTPVDYCAEVDEWLLVVAGHATLEIEAAQVELGPQDWMLIPAGTHHRLLDVAPGTSWITVTGPSDTLSPFSSAR